MQIDQKVSLLKRNLASRQNLAVAFSGGVDSTFLLKTAHEVLGDKVLAVIISSATFPRRELQAALDFVKDTQIKYQVLELDNLAIEGFADNPVNRCYLCKRFLYENICRLAAENHIKWVAEGSNQDDVGDYRPGMAAVQELGVISPLLDAELSKAEIRQLSRRLQLATWDKPAAACLASRFAYGQNISKEKLERVELAEDYLMDLGFKQLRVRVHDELARIELAPEERDGLFHESILDMIDKRFKELGFVYTSLDLAGYRTGSMNEQLNHDLDEHE